MLGFAKSVANGDVGQALQALGAQAGRLTNNPDLNKAMGFINDGTALVGALQQLAATTAAPGFNQALVDQANQLLALAARG